MRKRIWWSVIVVLLVGALTGYALNRPEAPDTRYSGAYVLDDGSFVFISPRAGKVLRYRTMQGESAALWPVADGQYEGGKGWAEREPVLNRVRFEMSADGHPLGLSWEHAGVAPRHAASIKLTEQIFTFHSGELAMRGKLVLPAGAGPFAAVVLVHGSESDSAVDYYFEPYMYAANGFAALVFDKRGTGKSEGEYVQNFSVLADDVRAAVRWLRAQPTIQPTQIHLAGFSQGGWIAPLAAFRDDGIRSLVIGYGPMVPVTGEDRWGYVYALHQKGFGEDAIAKADRLNEVIGDILDHGRNRWSELGDMLDAARDEPWFAVVKSSDSALGLVAGTKMPFWTLRLYAWWKLGRRHDMPFIDRLYNPVPTVAALSTPSLWIFGGQDSSMPTDWSVAELKNLQERGKPVEYVVYPDADHGILRFTDDANGERHTLGYESTYFQRQIDWLKQHSDARE
jgi:dienelactone hydrolase